MPAYTVSDGTNVYPLTELEISYTGTELDEAQFTIAGVYALDTAITIYSDTTAQFVGYVKEVEEIEQGALYKYTAYEKAVELKTMPYLSSTLDIFTKSSITIANLATDILTSAPDSGWDLASGMADTTSVTMNFYMVNRLQAINKVLREMRGYYVIFDSTTKTVKFLDSTGINTDRSASNMVYTSKTLISSSMLRGITQVVVIGKDSTIRGEYGSSTSSRAYYQVDDIATSAEALKIATAIYGDIGVSYEDYKVTVSPDEIQYDVRDKVKVDGSYYWIKSIIQGMDEIELILDDGRTSVIESFGSRIHLIEGNFPSGTDASWSGGNANIAANAAESTSFVWDIKDIAMISGAKIDAKISSFAKSATVAASSELLSDISPVISNGSYINTNWLSGTTYFPSSSGISVTTTNGHQFALATFNGDFYASASYGLTRIQIECQWSTNGSSWTTLTTSLLSTISTTSPVPVSFACLVPGTTSTTLYIRFVVTPQTDYAVRVYYGTYQYIQSIPRHYHSVSTIYDKSTTGTPPTTIQVSINNESFFQTLTPGTPLTISSYWTLVTGKNTIYIRTPSGAGNQCSVNPTITYQTLGKS